MSLVLKKLDDALPFRGLIRDRGQRRQLAELGGRVIPHGDKLRGAAVADRDGAGLVQEQRIDVAGHLNRLAALGDDVGAQGAIHAGNADGSQQGADGRGDEAYQERDQRRHVRSQALDRLALREEVLAQEVIHVELGIECHRPQGSRDDQKDEREGREHQRQSDLIGRALADGPLHEGDHAIQKRLAGAGGDADDNAVGQDTRAAGHAGAVAAGFADDRGRFTGNGRLVDRGDAFDDFTITGYDLAGDDLHEVAGHKFRGHGLFELSRVDAAEGGRGLTGLAQGVGLGLAARLRQRFGEVGEQHGEVQPDVQRQEVTEVCLALVAERDRDGIESCQHGADFDHEHHRVFPLDVGAQHDQRLLRRRLQKFRRKQAAPPAGTACLLQFLWAGSLDKWGHNDLLRHCRPLINLSVVSC